MPVIEINALLRAAPASRERFIDCFARLARMVREREEGRTLDYSYAQADRDPDLFHVREVYADVDALLAHMGNVPATTPELSGLMTVLRLDLTGAVPGEVAEALRGFCGDGFTRFDLLESAFP